jgi:acetyltransferase-like isoleucine patch superfamily enzyme
MKFTSENFYLVGGGGYGKQLEFMLKHDKIISSAKFVDDKLKFKIKNFLKTNKKIYFNITISNIKIRERIYNLSKKKNLLYTTLILPFCNIYSKKIGKGCIIEHNTTIANNVSIGLGSFIFTGTNIGHDTSIGNFCNVGSSVVISGNVNIGKKVIIGGQSFISNNLNICNNVVIAPGSVVLSDIKKPGIYNGNMLVKPF